jgi:nitroreductase
MEVSEAIRSRTAVRAFLPTPVPATIISDMLDAARFAPSGSNMQPWQVVVCQGPVKLQLSEEVVGSLLAGSPGQDAEYQYYPHPVPEPFLTRRRACGWGLYGALGIARGERERIVQQEARNFRFFDAPVGLFFFIDRALERGSWIDYGMFVQNVMLMARQHGLHTCPQAAWPPYHRIVRRHLGVPDSAVLVCGMSLGFADPGAVVNSFRPERLPVSAFTRFIGFGDAS